MITFDLQFFGDALLWVSLFFYCGGFVPQVMKNFRDKSTHGLSDAFILLYFTGYNAMLLYGFYCDLSLAYRVMLPLEAGLNTAIVCQRLYYGSSQPHPRFTFWVSMITLATLMAACWGFCCPGFIGLLTGWVALICFTVNQIPQIVKIFREKTTEGFSFGFISMFAVAQSCELVGGFIKCLPLPSILMAIRGIVIYFIYCWQFWAYRTR